MTVLVAQRADDALIRWPWIGDHLQEIWEATLAHLVLTAVPVGIGLVVSLVLAAVSLHWRHLYEPIAQTSAVLYTIPSLAAFALLVPFPSPFGLFGIGTAIVPLATYTLLILVRNIVTGIENVPDDVREAARGMGYRPVRLFFEIELPLALPVIIAGVRIATVTVVGLVTITALLGRGGLGHFILDAFRRSIIFPTEAFVGLVGTVALAGVLDLGLYLVQRALTPWTRRAGG
ncbi:MAG: ABC transporter permease [Actinobacteria bacterium]|nr:ABC transporter permease [Actinomycetota bacterium]